MRRLITAAAIVVAVVVGMGVNWAQERSSGAVQFPVSMQVGSDAEVGPLQVHVREIRAVQTVGRWDQWTEDWDELMESSGVWVVIDFSYSATDRSTFFSDTYLVDASGREYDLSSRVGTFSYQARAGLWEAGRMIFEVPTDSLGDYTLRLHTTPRYMPVPEPYGQLSFTLDADNVETEPVDTRYAELLPADER